MKPLWSIITLSATMLFTQNITLADINTHKDSIKSAQIVVDEMSKKTVESFYYPKFHFASKAYLMGSPTGVIYKNNEYHLFYQQNPYNMNQEQMYLAHATSPDLLSWENVPFAIAPSEDYDNNGVLSGSVIFDNDVLHILYTGRKEVLNNDKIENKETQN